MSEHTDSEPPSSLRSSHDQGRARTGAARAEAAKPGGSWLQRLASHLLVSSGSNLRETLENLLRAEDDGDAIFSKQERMMLLNILRFGGLRVEDVMAPRADIVALDVEEPLAELIRLFAEAGHSRVPVYRETLDDPQGMVHIKDLLRWVVAEGGARGLSGGPAGDRPQTPTMTPTMTPAGQGHNGSGGEEACMAMLDLRGIDLTKPISSARLVREVLYVPPSMPVVDLLLRMQSTRIHLALVVDEYGGTDGLLSIENLIEEVVGDIEDEHDEHSAPLVVEERDGRLVVDARTPIRDLEERLALPLQESGHENDADTIGGLIFSMLGRVPVRGELVTHSEGIEFEVLEADARRIRRLRVHRQPARRTAQPQEALRESERRESGQDAAAELDGQTKAA